jgi:glycosyltransferase involved in cell wall biosynthesis
MIMKPIKILYHLPGVQSPVDSGSKKRIAGILEYLYSRNNHIEVDAISANPYACGVWDKDQRANISCNFKNIYIYQGQKTILDFIESRCWSFWFQTILRRQLPIDSPYHTPRGYRKFFASILASNDYDYIWINYLDFWHLVNTKKAKRIRKIIDIHDISCRIRLARKSIPYLQGLKFNYSSNFQREINALKTFDHVLINSAEELTELSPYLDATSLIPHLLMRESNQDQILDYSRRSMKYDLLFVGTVYEPNIKGMNFFLAEIFPDLIAYSPTIKLAIVGNICTAINIPASLKNNVCCLGFVPDLTEIYLASRAVICPLLSGSGTKVKLQEAMAYGVPTVTTSVGASGLAFQDGVNAAIRDSPQGFAESIMNLLQNVNLASQYSHNVRRTFQEHYAEEVVYTRLDKILGLNVSSNNGVSQWIVH